MNKSNLFDHKTKVEMIFIFIKIYKNRWCSDLEWKIVDHYKFSLINEHIICKIFSLSHRHSLTICSWNYWLLVWDACCFHLLHRWASSRNRSKVKTKSRQWNNRLKQLPRSRTQQNNNKMLPKQNKEPSPTKRKLSNNRDNSSKPTETAKLRYTCNYLEINFKLGPRWWR